jgi:hypothetical protein
MAVPCPYPKILIVGTRHVQSPNLGNNSDATRFDMMRYSAAQVFAAHNAQFPMPNYLDFFGLFKVLRCLFIFCKYVSKTGYCEVANSESFF